LGFFSEILRIIGVEVEKLGKSRRSRHDFREKVDDFVGFLAKTVKFGRNDVNIDVQKEKLLLLQRNHLFEVFLYLFEFQLPFFLDFLPFKLFFFFFFL
jgi:hypothetical protein